MLSLYFILKKQEYESIKTGLMSLQFHVWLEYSMFEILNKKFGTVLMALVVISSA